MPLSKSGKYYLSNPTTINYFNLTGRSSSADNFYYFLETAAEQSGAWDYVPCARNDSSEAWAMLVSKSVSVTGNIAVIEFYTSDSYVIGCHYSNVPSALANTILSANSRTELTDLGLVRRSTSGAYGDLGSGTSAGSNYNAFTYTPGQYIVYAGPDVFTFFDLNGLSNDDSNYRSITNLFVLQRQSFYGGGIAKGLYIPHTSCRGLNSSGIGNYTFSIITLGANQSYSADIRDFPYIYNASFYLTPGYIISPAYIYIYDKPTSQLYKLDWLLITSTNVNDESLTYDNITYKPLGMVRYYYGDSNSLCEVYLRVDS